MFETVVIMTLVGAIVWTFGVRQALASRARVADGPYLKARLRRPGMRVISVRYRGRHGARRPWAPIYREYAIIAERKDGQAFKTTASVRVAVIGVRPFHLADQAGFDAFAAGAKDA